MAVKNTIKAIPLTDVDSAGFAGAFILISALPNACFMLRVINDSTVAVTISYDGVTAHDQVQAGATLVVPPSTISQPNNYIANFAQGTTVYASAPAAGVGLVYLAGYYQPTADK